MSETARNTSQKTAQGTRKSETQRTDRTARKKARFLEALAEGYSVTGACKKARIGRSTVYEWRDADPAFARAWDDAWEAGGDWYVDRNREMALQGNMAAILNGLNMHRRLAPARHELSGPGGGPIQVQGTLLAGMTPEEIRRLAEEPLE